MLEHTLFIYTLIDYLTLLLSSLMLNYLCPQSTKSTMAKPSIKQGHQPSPHRVSIILYY
jgi:hypothetical protein